MELKKIDFPLTVCKLASAADIRPDADFCFVARTDEEISLVCKTEDTPQGTLARDDGWRAFRIQGVLDFSLIGILAKLSGILAAHRIGILYPYLPAASIAAFLAGMLQWLILFPAEKFILFRPRQNT